MIFMVPEAGDDLWPTLGMQVADWIEDNLVFGPGDLRGEPAIVDSEKRAILCHLYEVYPKGHEQEGRRRFKRAGISLPKGMAKTEFMAWIAAAELHPDGPVRTVGWDGDQPIGGGVTDPYIPLVAYTEEQSDELAYGALKAILELSEVAGDFDIGLERIMRIGGDGKAVSLSGSPNARDGARTTFQGFDETHWFTLDKLKKGHQTMLQNLPKRYAADAWALETTTAFEPGAGSVAEATMDYAKALKGKEDGAFFFYHRQAGDEHDLTTEEGAREAVIEASGPNGLFRDIAGIIELWRTAKDKKYWERVWLNRPVQGSNKAFDLEAFNKLASPRKVPDGSTIVIGFDGAQRRDATGLVATHVETGYQWLCGLWQKPEHDANWVVPVREVDECIADLFRRFRVWRMYADPPYWQEHLSRWQGQYGDDVIIDWWTNRRRQMAHALEGYHSALTNGVVSHDGNEDFAKHMGNAYKQEISLWNEEGERLWLIRKERHDSPNKIDVAMAACLSWEARTDALAKGVSEEPMYETDLEAILE